MFRCFINSSSSIFVLIRQMLLSTFVGQNIFLKIFLSNTESLCIMLSFKTHVTGSQLVKKFQYLFRNPKDHFRSFAHPVPLLIQAAQTLEHNQFHILSGQLKIHP
jgi:hypothetical protein